MKLELISIDRIRCGENISRDHMGNIEVLAEALVSNLPTPTDPIDVTKDDEEYHLKAGFRRVAAHQLLVSRGDKRFRKIPALVHDDLDQREGAFKNIVENIVRKDLTSYESAHAYLKVHARYGTPATEIAKRVGKDASTVANLIRLAKQLHPTIQQAWRNRDGTERAIPVTWLLTIASYDHDIQLKKYEQSVYAPRVRDGPSSEDDIGRMRNRREIERGILIAEEHHDIQTAHALRWVLRKESRLYDGHNRNDGRDPAERKPNGASARSRKS